MMILNPLDFASNAQKIREAIDFAKAAGEGVTFVVTMASVVANKLPRYEGMAEGRGRNFYQKVVIPTVAFLALNWRKRLVGLDWNIGPFKHVEPCPTCGHVHEPPVATPLPEVAGTKEKL